MQRQKWTREKVITAIRQRSSEQLPITARYMSLKCTGLYHAGCTYIGSWKQAVEAAGFTYADIRVGKQWTKDDIVAGIRSRVGQGLLISSHVVQHENWSLAYAGRSRFGSWKKAVEAAGYDYHVVNKYAHRKCWSRQTVIKALLKRHAAKLSLSISDVQRDDNPLARAGVNHFGSWAGAIAAAGFDYDKVIKLWYFRRRVSHCRIEYHVE